MSETERIIQAILGAVITDLEVDIPNRHIRNTGSSLETRLNIQRAIPRKGDAKYYRSLYTAIRWLAETEHE